MSMDMYQENIIDHYENPRNFGHLDKFTVKSEDSNPLCGDKFEFELLIKEDKIADVRFDGHGCAISTAAASMLSEELKGKSLEHIKKLDKEDILGLLGIELSHVRIKCAMLPLKITKMGAYDFLSRR